MLCKRLAWVATEDVLATDLDACVLCAVWVATSTGGGSGSSGSESTTKAPAISDGGTGSGGGDKGGQQ